ncbi:hypothetical protein GGR58DRAFT_471018 [Xylaria digitata]|nr:hypothetical protein GGR58DRAFT_471018 [Xylaria digitata]
MRFRLILLRLWSHISLSTVTSSTTAICGDGENATINRKRDSPVRLKLGLYYIHYILVVEEKKEGQGIRKNRKKRESRSSVH